MEPASKTSAVVAKTILLLFLLFTVVVFLTSPSLTLTFAGAQGEGQGESAKNFSLLPESWAREAAVRTVAPDYPTAAIQRGISGVVHIKFETNTDGEVVRIKVKPHTEPLLAKAVAAAVKQWKFKARQGPEGSAKPVLSRLIFRFTLDAAEPKVGLFEPGPHPPDVQHLGYYNSAKEMREWPEVPNEPKPSTY